MKYFILLLFSITSVLCIPTKPTNIFANFAYGIWSINDQRTISSTEPYEVWIDHKRNIMRMDSPMMRTIEINHFNDNKKYRFYMNNGSIECHITAIDNPKSLSYDMFKNASYTGLEVIKERIMYRWENVDFFGMTSTVFFDVFTGKIVSLKSADGRNVMMDFDIRDAVQVEKHVEISPELASLCKTIDNVIPNPHTFGRCMARKLFLSLDQVLYALSKCSFSMPCIQHVFGMSIHDVVVAFKLCASTMSDGSLITF